MGGGPFPRKEVRARAKPVRRERKRIVSESPNVTLCIMARVSQGSMRKELRKAARLVRSRMGRLLPCSCESACNKTEYDGFEHRKSAPPGFQSQGRGFDSLTAHHRDTRSERENVLAFFFLRTKLRKDSRQKLHKPLFRHKRGAPGEKPGAPFSCPRQTKALGSIPAGAMVCRD